VSRILRGRVLEKYDKYKKRMFILEIQSWKKCKFFCLETWAQVSPKAWGVAKKKEK
jgi:hypothetical protein